MWGDFGFGKLIRVIEILFIVALLGVGNGVYDLLFVDHKTFKTTTPPIITWELKAKGQRVDTVWVYKFK